MQLCHAESPNHRMRPVSLINQLTSDRWRQLSSCLEPRSEVSVRTCWLIWSIVIFVDGLFTLLPTQPSFDRQYYLSAKVRVVAEENLHNRGLFDDLSPPTVHAHVHTIAPIVATEVIAIDIEDAFLDADMPIRGNDAMLTMLMQLWPVVRDFSRDWWSSSDQTRQSILWMRWDIAIVLVRSQELVVWRWFHRETLRSLSFSKDRIERQASINLMVTSESRTDLDNFG